MVKFYEGGADKKKQQFDAAQAELDKVSVNFMPLFIKIYVGILVVYRIIRSKCFVVETYFFRDNCRPFSRHFFSHRSHPFFQPFDRFSLNFPTPFQSIFRHLFNRSSDLFYRFSDTTPLNFPTPTSLKFPTIPLNFLTIFPIHFLTIPLNF
jgi:hypothetical protein